MEETVKDIEWRYVELNFGPLGRRAGAAAGGDAAEAAPERPNSAAGGGEEQLAGAAGGGRGEPLQPGEAAADGPVAGQRMMLALSSARKSEMRVQVFWILRFHQ